MSNNKEKILKGALVGAVLGIVAGMLLAPESGAKLRRNIKKVSAEFYEFIAPKLKKMGKISKKEYEAFIKKSMEVYSKAKKLSVEESKVLAKEAQVAWKHLKKHL